MSASTTTAGPTYTWTPEKLALFKKRYELHKTDEDFVFAGMCFVPAYAKYLIEYLDGEFAAMDKRTAK